MNTTKTLATRRTSARKGVVLYRKGGTALVRLNVTLDPVEKPLDQAVLAELERAPEGAKMAEAAALMREGIMRRLEQQGRRGRPHSAPLAA